MSSDLDETWWKLFPRVPCSFLNSSGTKIAGKKPQKHEIMISKNSKTYVFLIFARNFLLFWPVEGLDDVASHRHIVFFFLTKIDEILRNIYELLTRFDDILTKFDEQLAKFAEI